MRCNGAILAALAPITLVIALVPAQAQHDDALPFLAGYPPSPDSGAATPQGARADIYVKASKPVSSRNSESKATGFVTSQPQNDVLSPAATEHPPSPNSRHSSPQASRADIYVKSLKPDLSGNPESATDGDRDKYDVNCTFNPRRPLVYNDAIQKHIEWLQGTLANNYYMYYPTAPGKCKRETCKYESAPTLIKSLMDHVRALKADVQ
ncbi:hypothetical protein Purlil1_11869 [Purpureocillium lilacinum]|uniref:Uncharacterized protein n=1 Tax=Purpureocillium lilacinum TaxID=33203 RepID=A0ABR0BIC2_PURLI|nr:hypothetical protein Purlil1_11869 [Purpureocillium lilacinum]